MRKIAPEQILCFILLASLGIAIGIGVVALTLGWLPLGDFRGVVLTVAAVIACLISLIGVHRAYLHYYPFGSGEIAQGSVEEFRYHVYLLFYLIFFYPVMLCMLLPIPLIRSLYLALGARLGDNTYSSGVILDPKFVEVGSNTIIGRGSLIIPHVIEGERLAHYPVRIGSNVTIGAHAVVLSGCTIEDGAIVAVAAVVPKNTHIRTGEVWGGLPARCLRTAP